MEGIMALVDILGNSYATNAIPIILMLAGIWFFIGYAGIKGKISKIISKVCGIVIIIYICWLYIIVIPCAMITSPVYGQDYNMTTMMFIVCAVWFAISLFVRFRNELILLINNEKEIYIRDIQVDYSPAILSYLVNNNTDINTVLPATILNLCVKGVIKLQEDNDGNVKIINLNKVDLVNQLSEDEKYAYEMITSSISSSKVAKWKEIIKEEYDKYKFSNEHKISLFWYLFYTYIIILILNVVMLCLDVVSTERYGSIFLFTIVFTIWSLPIALVINSIFSRTKFKDKYTVRGAIELNRWRKFEKFINDFTLINQKEYKSIAILGKYLSYSVVLRLNNKCDKELLRKVDLEYSFNIEKILNKIII